MANKYDKILGVYREKDAGTPGGSNTNIQYNNSGAFGGSAELAYDSANNKVTIGSSATANVGAGLLINDRALQVLGRINEGTSTIIAQLGLGPSADSARFLLGHPTGNWQIDNDGSGMRFFLPGNVRMVLTSSALALGSSCNLTYSGAITQTGTNTNTFTANTAVNRILTVGLAGTLTGQIDLKGTTSGTVSVLPQAAAGTYNFNIPTTAGSSGDVLTSGGGAGSAMTWTSNVLTTTNTATVTNKRITKRVLALSAGSGTPAINTDSYDVVHITAQSAAITSFTTNLTGTPVDGDTLRISITDNGTARALTWGTSFESSTTTLPTTTVISTRLDVGFFWNTETSKWRCVATS